MEIIALANQKEGVAKTTSISYSNHLTNITLKISLNGIIKGYFNIVL